MKIDLSDINFETSDKMRYDTPGDWSNYTITAWNGLAKANPDFITAVQLHEFNESVICRAAGITPKVIDTIDNYKQAIRDFAAGAIDTEELLLLAKEYMDVPYWIIEIYEQAHELSLLVERAFIEAAGHDWKKYNDYIESTRGRIPHE